jgi:putative ABC transport system permease protein
MGANTVYVAKMSISSFASGKKFIDVLRRPNITEEDAKAIKAGAPAAMMVGWQLGNGPGSDPQRLSYHNISTKLIPIIGASSNFADINYIGMDEGRFFTPFEQDHRRNVIVLGYSIGETLFPAIDAIGKTIRLNEDEFTVIGVMGKRPSPLGGDPNAFAVIPSTTYDKLFDPPRIRGLLQRFLFMGVVGYPNVPRDQLMSQVQEVMRSRHRLKVDQENDFDIVTSDMIMGIFDQFTRAIFLALVVISSIALMVGGIGVMAIMTISVTERTREIGIRKALGARRREILWQFLLEAVFLTSIGGLLGILFGSAIGMIVHYGAGFPVSLPWWSFAIGIGFSASVGIFFGLWPAFKASRLDPIEALRYE